MSRKRVEWNGHCELFYFVIANEVKQSPYFEEGKRIPIQYFPQRHKKQNAEIASSLHFVPFLAMTGWGEGEIAS